MDCVAGKWNGNWRNVRYALDRDAQVPKTQIRKEKKNKEGKKMATTHSFAKLCDWGKAENYRN